MRENEFERVNADCHLSAFRKFRVPVPHRHRACQGLGKGVNDIWTMTQENREHTGMDVGAAALDRPNMRTP